MADTGENSKQSVHKSNIRDIWNFLEDKLRNLLFYSGIPTVILFIYIILLITGLAYACHYCIIGLVIGCAVSYGLQENKQRLNKILLFLIYICSISTIWLYSLGYKFFFLSSPINIFLFSLVCLGMGGVIFYRKNRYINIFYVGISFAIYLVISVMYKPFQEEYNNETALRLQQLYLLFFSFFSLIIAEFISHKVKQKGYPGKKQIFIWIVLFSLIIHSGLSFVFYGLAPNDVVFQDGSKVDSYCKFLYFRFYNNCYPQMGYHYYCYYLGEEKIHKFNFYEEIVRFYEKITFGKIDSDNINVIIGIQLWIAEFLITIFCAWKFVVSTCLSTLTLNNNNIQEKT